MLQFVSEQSLQLLKTQVKFPCLASRLHFQNQKRKNNVTKQNDPQQHGESRSWLEKTLITLMSFFNYTLERMYEDREAAYQPINYKYRWTQLMQMMRMTWMYSSMSCIHFLVHLHCNVKPKLTRSNLLRSDQCNKNVNVCLDFQV